MKSSSTRVQFFISTKSSVFVCARRAAGGATVPRPRACPADASLVRSCRMAKRSAIGNTDDSSTCAGRWRAFPQTRPNSSWKASILPCGCGATRSSMPSLVCQRDEMSPGRRRGAFTALCGIQTLASTRRIRQRVLARRFFRGRCWADQCTSAERLLGSRTNRTNCVAARGDERCAASCLMPLPVFHFWRAVSEFDHDVRHHS